MKEDRHIENMIRESLGMKSAPEGFTDKVMGKILQEEMAKEMALRSLFQKHAMHSPSEGFVQAVSENIEAAGSRMQYKSVISKKAWIFIFMFVGAIFIYALLAPNGSEANSGVFGATMDQAVNKISRLGTAVNFELPALLTNPLFGLSILAISSLLLIDKVVQDRKISINI